MVVTNDEKLAERLRSAPCTWRGTGILSPRDRREPPARYAADSRVEREVAVSGPMELSVAKHAELYERLSEG